MKIRSSVKIAVSFLVLVFVGYYGWNLYAGLTVDNIKFASIKPSKVNIVGIKADSEYRILVANQAAQLIRGGAGDFQGEVGDQDTETTEKKRVPIREMLQAMQGDAVALGQFVAIMNDMQENDEWPTERVIWKEDSLKQALDGDPVLRAKLESDLNIKLDGTPLKQISIASYENGIVVETYIPCKVQVGDSVVDMKGPFQVPYRPGISRSIAKQLEGKAYDKTTVAGYYALENQKLAEGKAVREKVADALRRLIDPQINAELARPAQQVLQSASIVITDQQISKATAREYEAGGEKLNEINIELTEEGRKRLWQYSRHKVGSQLLLIVNGVAIAAPRIKHELAQSELQIQQLPDKILVQDAIDTINDKSGAKS